MFDHVKVNYYHIFWHIKQFQIPNNIWSKKSNQDVIKKKKRAIKKDDPNRS